jgi:hypothetical protein
MKMRALTSSFLLVPAMMRIRADVLDILHYRFIFTTLELSDGRIFRNEIQCRRERREIRSGHFLTFFSFFASTVIRGVIAE